MIYPSEYYGDVYRWFVGEVREVDKVTSVRARVRIYGIHDFNDNVLVSDGDLPWALVTQSVNGIRGSIVEEGMVVHGFFLDHDNSRQPLITGIISTGPWASMDGSPISGENNDGLPYDKPPSETPAETPGGTPSGTPPATLDAPSNVPDDVKSRLQIVYNYVRTKLEEVGSNNAHLHASAITGSIQAESTGLPTIKNPTKVRMYIGRDANGQKIYQERQAFGLHQWLGVREDHLIELYPKTYTTYTAQLAFFWKEFTEYGVLKRMLAASTVTQANDAMVRYGRGEDWRKIGKGGTEWIPDHNHPNWKTRQRHINGIYKSSTFNLAGDYKKYKPITPSVPGNTT